jgi:hypothetical protein
MSCKSKTYYRCILFLLLFPLSSLLLAQKVEVPVTAAVDSFSLVTGPDRHAFYSGAGYGSNMIYLGTTMSQDQPYSYANITYGFRNKLYAAVSAVNLSKLDRPAAFYTGGLSFSHPFNKTFDISAGVYRYQVDKILTDTLFNSFNYGDATIGIDWKLIYTQISYGSMISKEPQGFFQINNSRYFQTPEFFRKKANFSFDPYINLLFGTLYTSEIKNGISEITTVQQYISPLSQVSGSSSSGGSSRGYGAGYGSAAGNGPGAQQDPGEGQGSPAGTGTSETTTVTTTTTVPTITTSFAKSFNLIEIELGLPVSFNTNSMTIEAEAAYVLPAYSDPYFPGPKGFVLTLSCFLKIF